MSAWKDHVTAALIGMESGGSQATPALPAELDGALAVATSTLSPEAAFLTRAGAMAWWRRAGYRPPVSAEPPPLPCSPDTAPLVSDTSSGHLRLMLGGFHAEVLPEWLGEVARYGRLITPELLPPLLEWVRTAKAERPLVLAAGGARVRWLAACHPAWDFAAAADPTHWETGSREQRVSILRGWRAADPLKGLEKLVEVWASEPADMRTAFLAVLETGLGPADEPFLERALDDRSKEVRQAAANLLARLPGSAFVARMVARANPILIYKRGGLLRKASLEIALPEPPDAAGTRDGLDPKKASGTGRAFGEKANLLAQIFGAVPPSHWTTICREEPATLVAAVRKHNFARAVLTGWSRAAWRHRDAAWAAALLETSADLQAPPDLVPPGVLLGVLSEEARVRRLAAGIRGGTLGKSEDWQELHQLVWSFQPHLPVPVAQDLLHALRALATKPLPWHLQNLLKTVALKVPPKLLPFALDNWPEPNHAAALVDAMHFRREALTALTQS